MKLTGTGNQIRGRRNNSYVELNERFRSLKFDMIAMLQGNIGRTQRGFYPIAQTETRRLLPLPLYPHLRR